MKLYRLLTLILLSALTAYSQGTVSAEDKALLDKLSRDHAFITINRAANGWLDEVNNPKWALYKAFQEQSPNVLKVFKRQRAGWEGQYTMTWFTVLSGKASIVEAYFGDPSGSDELQYVRQYKPDKIVLGHFDKARKCVPTIRFGNSKTEELCLLYNVPSEPIMKVF